MLKSPAEMIDRNFKYHRPFGDQQKRYERIRDEARCLAHTVHYLCPDSREKSLAITNLEQAVMWANAAIARNEKEGDACINSTR